MQAKERVMDHDKITPDILFEIIGRAVAASPSSIKLDTDIFENLGVDSLGIVEIFTEIGVRSGVNVNPASLDRNSIRTPAHIIALISK